MRKEKAGKTGGAALGDRSIRFHAGSDEGGDNERATLSFA
jgi:hypothetical protein